MSTSILDGTRVYLSGPMDFVGSRVIEKYLGWRAIITPIMKALGITVLDPWNKPQIRGHRNYGREGILPEKSVYEKDFWTNAETRAKFERDFWQTVHIDLRMTDVADFLLAFVPTNIYSVGTVHEIVIARRQHKPVLLVSPPVKYEFFPELAKLSDEAKKALKFYGLKENPNGIPSQWYGNIVGGHNMFNGFGWEGIPFKESMFYERLITTVLDNAKPREDNEEGMALWKKVSAWVTSYEPLTRLTGGILDHVTYEGEEEALVKDALATEAEQRRTHFWYNTRYTPERSVLFQLLCIASGYIPPKTHISAALNDDESVSYTTYESIDDNWLLISHEGK